MEIPVHNARCMGRSLENLDAIMISHGHYDHPGGLADVLSLPGRPAIYVHPSALEDKFARNTTGPPRRIGIPEAARKALEEVKDRVVWTRTTTELTPGIAATGEVPRSHPLEDVGGPFFQDAACRSPDPLVDDQAVWIETAAGLVVVLGCAHSGVINTLDHIRRLTGRQEVYGLAGGTHLHRASRERLGATGTILGRLNAQVIAACHCTGLEAQVYFRARFASRVQECGTGAQFEFASPRGLNGAHVGWCRLCGYITVRGSTILLHGTLLALAIGAWGQSGKQTIMTVTEAPRTSIPFHAIGVIRTPFPRPEGTPIQPSRSGGAKGSVEVFSHYRQGLKDLEGFDRVWLVYWMHLAPEARLLVTPFLDNQERGVFATRAPARPNAIGISSVRLLRIDGNTMEVADVDIVDGTPLLDIKPYVPEFDCHANSRAGWFDESSSRRRVADDRFKAGSNPKSLPKR